MTEALSEILGGRDDIVLLKDYPYSRISTIHTGGKIAWLIYPKSEEALLYSINLLRENGLEWKLIGNASNIIPPDRGTDCAVISTRMHRCVSHNGEIVTASCGCSLISLINYANKHSLSGLENLAGIPATVGGAVYNNCGAFETSISDCLYSCCLYDVKADKAFTLTREDMHLSYRHSLLKENELVLLSASFSFVPDAEEAIAERKRRALARKNTEQPVHERSFGSVFLRMGDIAPAYLIDRAGLKGLAVGGAEISRKHAGFIINKNNATSADVTELIEKIKQIIYEMYGYRLVCEVEIGG